MEKENLVKVIESTFEKLKKELSKFDKETLNKVPFEGSWTAGQTAEHIIISSSGIPDSQTTKTNRPFNEKVSVIGKLFLNFDLKFEADTSISPGPGPHQKEVLIQKIEEIKISLKEVTQSTDLKALCEDMELPTFGLLTRYEWLRFILFHTQRHTHQIANIGSKVL